MPSADPVATFLARLQTSLGDDSFVRLTLSQPIAANSAEKATARLIAVRGQPCLSVTLQQGPRATTSNLPAGNAAEWARAQLASFRSALLHTTRNDWQLHVPATGTPRLVRHKPAFTAAPARTHDEPVRQVLDASANDWLHGLEVTEANGRVRAPMLDKHRQINRYLEILAHLAQDCGWLPTPGARGGDASSPVGVRGAPPRGSGVQSAELGQENSLSEPGSGTGSLPVCPDVQNGRATGQAGCLSHCETSATPTPIRPLSLADMGCGKGYLTFGAWHLFHRVHRLDVRVLGVETRPDLVDFTSHLASRIGATGLSFQAGTIESATLPPVDALVALHACNTATDDALRRGIELGAKLIVVAPCCHQELRPQLGKPEPLAGVLRHGIMEERLAEWLTDGLRALFLEWAGYRTKVFEFVSSEHTPKNLMIAAIREREPFTDAAARQRIIELKRFFGIERHALDPLLVAADVRRLTPGGESSLSEPHG